MPKLEGPRVAVELAGLRGLCVGVAEPCAMPEPINPQAAGYSMTRATELALTRERQGAHA